MVSHIVQFETHRGRAVQRVKLAAEGPSNEQNGKWP
eukprot:CAMPEP_0171101794 /NCGR_PEP_ID=MMETSP0766_2-20121228/56022_1 /TAXON_ID=439317 /ORGANISM="Gambierdiscus australes, Strain CAWD 149" /LENGTH=35 /DNA_ID= /DNA_START= /DNA_END= /DNA_ORIENTATION=